MSFEIGCCVAVGVLLGSGIYVGNSVDVVVGVIVAVGSGDGVNEGAEVWLGMIVIAVEAEGDAGRGVQPAEKRPMIIKTAIKCPILFVITPSL
jgi:hypothetical protein